MRNNMTIALKRNKYRIYLVVLEFVDILEEIVDIREGQGQFSVETQDIQEGLLEGLDMLSEWEILLF